MNPTWQKTPSGKLRARGLGLPLSGTPGPNNAITDVAGVEVGYATLIAGEGALKVGQGPVRTGVTAIFPRGRARAGHAVWAGAHSLNGNGELTGAWWMEESGRCELAITITNTHSCGTTRDATLQWAVRQGLAGQQAEVVQDWGLPVAAETFDGHLNDINGFHVKLEHVFQALDGAQGGPIEEGAVGGGTGMICYGFKGGSGTASRLVEEAGRWTLGAFVQANFGRTPELVVLGRNVGRELSGKDLKGAGSIIVVLATDAPLLPHQLKRLARRATLGIARTGTIGHNSSGDIFLAFTTANGAALLPSDRPVAVETLPEDKMDSLFTAAVESVEEAILNALVANETMVGRDGHRIEALPHSALK
jgi:L-aminopeptidase/D-esterase-like protein